MAEQEKNKTKGLIASIGFHGILLVLFAFYGMTYSDPPPEDNSAIPINWGDSDDGMMTNNPNKPAVEAPDEQPEEVEEQAEEDILTQDDVPAPVVEKKQEEKKEEIKPVEKKAEPKPNKTLSLADRMRKKDNSEAGGDGKTDQAGDQGKSNGDPNSKNYDGVGGNGNGSSSFSLSGRSRKFTPKIKDDSQDEGTVVVDIIVDKYGKVVRATAGARGSNTTSAILYKKAREAALKTKFNADPDAAEAQKGTITFIFILN